MHYLTIFLEYFKGIFSSSFKLMFCNNKNWKIFEIKYMNEAENKKDANKPQYRHKIEIKLSQIGKKP